MKKILIKNQKSDIAEPTTQDWSSWTGQKCGKYFIGLIEEKIKNIQDDFINGDFTGESIESSVQRASEGIGKAQAYADIILTLDEKRTDDEQNTDNYQE